MDNVETIVDPNEQGMDIINDVFPFASTNTNQEGKDDVPTPMDSAAFEQYEKTLKKTNISPRRKACILSQKIVYTYTKSQLKSSTSKDYAMPCH